jgi:drug/metabolite transporter (DMT)-like permease
MSLSVANQRGIIGMVSAMALFTANDACVKLVSATIPASQVMAIRGLFAFVLALSIMLLFREGSQIHHLRRPLVLVRALLEAIVAGTFITAVAVLPLAIIAAILQSTPIIMTLIVVIFRLEKVGLHRWLATIIGFIGVLLVVKPSAEGVNSAIIIALISALAVACRDLLTRRIPNDIPSSVITLGTTLGVAEMGLLLGLGHMIFAFIWPGTPAPLVLAPWQALGAYETVLLMCAATLVTIGNFAIILAFRNTDVSLISPFRYSVMLWAVIVGYLVFQEWPDWIAQIGMALIVIAGVYTLRVERRAIPVEAQAEQANIKA